MIRASDRRALRLLAGCLRTIRRNACRAQAKAESARRKAEAEAFRTALWRRAAAQLRRDGLPPILNKGA